MNVTTAYILAVCKIIPPNYFNHDPLLLNGTNNKTVAHKLANNGIIPPK